MSTRVLSQRELRFIREHNSEIKQLAAAKLVDSGALEMEKLPAFLQQTKYTTNTIEGNVIVMTEESLFTAFKRRDINSYLQFDETTPEVRERDAERILVARINGAFDDAHREVREKYELPKLRKSKK